ncbi:MAG: ATP-binding cassette domain-containing protein [Candidatus Diapherotrites archaeon]|nr:ATP-binding cassette domain-containing protein [Candidatus Diapherotrites archaeon]
MPAIDVKGLTKKFGELTAVDNISFEINSGEIFGFLGPNGAGKTTTISMLSTLLKPSSGTATVNGFDILKDEDNVRKSIGVVFQDQSLDEELTAFENMEMHGMLYRVEKNLRLQKIAELLKLVGLIERQHDLVKNFSGGMRRRLEIARGLLHEPKVLFLDEPTIGLDPQTRNHLWEYIAKLNKEKGITIILTTHYMEEADKLCNRIGIIDKGKLVALDEPQKLKDGIGGDVITIKSVNSEKIHAKIKASWITHSEKHDGFVTLNVQNAEQHVKDVVSILGKEEIVIDSISVHKPTLEDVFLHFTGRTIRDEEANNKDSMRMHKKMWRGK